MSTSKRLTRVQTLLSSALLTLSGCGGPGGGPNQPAPPAPDPWVAVKTAVDNSSVNNMRLVIGDSNGVLLDYEKGSFATDGQHLIASATKWLSALVVYRLIEQGVMTAQDQPQDYLPYWTNDPNDPRSRITLQRLLAFTSGFNNPPAQPGCVGNGMATLQSCVQTIYATGLDTEPGTAFAYGPEHLHIAAAMAEVASGLGFSELFDQSIRAGLTVSMNTRIVVPSAQNPRASGGGESSVDDAVSILQDLLSGNALADTAPFYADNTATPVTFAFRPSGIGQDWHYAQGAWRVCEQPVWDLSCENKVILSSPGAFGWTPWIDETNGYFGLIAMEESIFTSPSETAVELMIELLPLVEAQVTP